MIVFASSMDDFVISAFLSPDASSVTVPIKLYSSVRNAPPPRLNALATLLGVRVIWWRLLLELAGAAPNARH